MSDYKCDICEKKATVHITKFIGGQKLKFHLCEDCAKNHKEKLKALIETQIELKHKSDFQVEDIIADMLDSPKNVYAGKECPHCKSTFEDFDKLSSVPCEHCYDAFSKKIEELLGQMHLSTEHKGKRLGSPKKAKLAKKMSKASAELQDIDFKKDTKGDSPSVEELSAELELAISQERYEDAALLRDKIKSLKGLA